MIAVSTLLKSCATPPASWPIACIFWLCTRFSCSVRCSVVSSAKMVALAPSSSAGSAAETKRRAERAAPAPSSDTSSGAISPLPWAAASIDALNAARSRSATRSKIDSRPLAASLLGAAWASRANAALGRNTAPAASTAAIATGVELKMRANRTSAARRSSPLMSPGARLITSERDGPGAPSPEKATLWRMRAGKQPALARLEVDVELLRRHFARAAGHHGEHRAAVSGDDVVDLEPADAELGEIVVEPAGEGGVHMRDRAVGLGGKKACGRVVEIVDRVLEILEEGFVPVVVAGLVRNRPHHQPVPGDALERANANAVPGDLALAASAGARDEAPRLLAPAISRLATDDRRIPRRRASR